MFDRVRESSAIHLAIGVLISIVFFRFQFYALSGGLDSSWIAVMSYGAAHHLYSGIDYQWTWGPLGHLVIPVALGPLGLAPWFFQIAVFVLFSVSVQSYFRSRKIQPKWLLLLITVATLAVFGSMAEDLFIYIGLFLAMNAAQSNHKLRWISLLAIFSLVGLLVKIAYGVPLLTILVTFGLWDCIENRKDFSISRLSSFLVIPLVFLGWLLIWFVLGGGIATWLRSIKVVLEFSRGYFSAMTSSQSIDSPWLLALSALILFGAFWQLMKTREGRVLTLISAPLFYLGVRYGVTKQLVILSPLMYIFSWLGFWILEGKKKKIQFALTMALLFTSLSANFNWHERKLSTQQRLFGRLEAAWGRFLTFSSLNWVGDWKHRTDQSALAADRLKAPAHILATIGKSTVDVYPFELTVLPASKLNWSPRAVIQAYQAYTPYLDNLDTEFLSSPSAPDFYLIQDEEVHSTFNQSIDSRLVWNDEPRFVRGLIEHYKFVESEGNWQLYAKKTSAPLNYTQASESVLEWGEWQTVPAFLKNSNAIAIAEIPIERTLLGKLRATFYKEPPQMMEYRMSDGSTTSFRYIIDMARDGLWISPLWQDLKGKGALRVEAFRLLPSWGHKFCYREHPMFRWMSLKLPQK